MPFPTRILALAGAALFIAGSVEAESLTLTQGEVRREPAPGTVANVVVADPTVADVTVIDQHSVVISGKGVGMTGVLATDRAGHVLIDDRIIVTALPQEGRITLYRGTMGLAYRCTPHCGAGVPLGPSDGGGNPASSESQAGRGVQTPVTVAPQVAAGGSSYRSGP